jgi:ABC-type lipoprotein release transport system permease subunit
MRVVIAWLRVDVRRHWRSLTVLALLIAIASGTVLAALAGARRGASVQERLNARTLPATSAILANTPGFDWGPIRALPEVEAMSNFVVDYTMSTEGIPAEAVGFPYTDDELMHTFEKPVIFKGRMYDSTRADEAVVTRRFVAHYHKGIGDTVVLILATPQEIVAQQGSGPNGAYTGPRVTVRIVGVGETSSAWGGTDGPGSDGGMQPSPGLYAKYPENIVGPPGGQTVNYVNAVVRLRGGEAAIPQLRNDIKRVTGRSDIDVSNLADQQRVVQHHIAFESRCLVAFAVAAFVAALFLVGQAIARYAAASTVELRTLRALGMTPRQAIGAAVAGPAMAGVIGAVLGAAGAIFASRWLPFGTAGLIEPAPGVSVDWVVLGLGLAVVAALVAGGAAGAAWLALGAARRADVARRSTIAVAVARAGLPVPVVVGTRFALEAGRGRAAVPVRPALVGAVMGVVGILAAFTFSRGVSDAASHPERFGQTFQLTAFVGLNGQDFGPAANLVSALHANSDVTGVDDARTAVATGPGGDGSVSLWAYSSAPKAIPVVITSGRLPESADEVVLGPRTLAALHTHVGARLELSGNKGPATFTVTGTGLVPQGPHNGYADGGWITQHGYDAIFTGFKFHVVLVTLRPSARTSDAATALAAAIKKSTPGLDDLSFGPPDRLAEVAALREVRELPILLGLFLALLAVGAVGHALATAVRRRSHDLAVLRALGMTRRQCRWVVVTQASLLAVIGLIFGVPLGLAVGRSVWRAVANYTPIEYVPPMAVWALLLVGPAALLIANALAAWPGHRAARLRVAQILRAE